MLHSLFFYLISFSDELPFTDTVNDSLNVPSMFPENMKVEIIKMICSLVFLLAFFALGAWGFRKFLKSKGQTFGNGSTIKILERRSLTPKTTIYLIRVINKILIIAETAEQVTLLSEFPPNTDINELLQNNDIKSSASSSDLLSKAIQKFHRNKDLVNKYAER
ncbi:flagellar biosynthetic protein FliO [Chlamydia ibidis]|uniref:Flagellar biosynthetic protein FliO n=2 Tax=Chlamydia ibidis TaxID=1405396 RepID=S7J477_9CHLA|nr:FliO/MopB family protein [Chlamydia ibidis]EPP35038.1 flagellar biosynthetic protein FliO [Chlamydia ibidis]EQM62812.1 flagellar biosynthetic protein FliO [Chlamydia ibidis 10-1398/6]